MNRAGLTLSGILAIIGASKILFPAQVAAMFALDVQVALFALFTAVIAYGVWFGPLKFLSGSVTLRAVGFAIFALGLISINSPTLFGLRSAYLPIADIFLIIESGIVLQLIGLEKRQTTALTPLIFVTMAWQVVQRRLHRRQVTFPASQ